MELVVYWLNLSNALSELVEQECDPDIAKEAFEAGEEAFKRIDSCDDAFPGPSSDFLASYLTGFELKEIRPIYNMQSQLFVLQSTPRRSAMRGDVQESQIYAIPCALPLMLTENVAILTRPKKWASKC